MTKMANRINKYQSRLTIWKIASNAWFTTALVKLPQPLLKSTNKILKLLKFETMLPKIKSRDISNVTYA